MDDTNKRHFRRVDDLLPFTYQRVLSEDYELLRKKYISGTLCDAGAYAFPPSLNDLMGNLEEESPNAELFTAIIQFLHSIDTKLDFIANQLSGKKEESLLFKKPEKINISGSGARFAAKGYYGKGEILEIKILLPGCPMILIPALGEVVRSTPIEELDRWDTAVRFTAISEDNRDQLTRYIVRMERGILRSMAERKSSSFR